jgi:hypothetical protein
MIGVAEEDETAVAAQQSVSPLERYTGVLAEREGFEPSLEVLAPKTV